jgi:hypothetical protein
MYVAGQSLQQRFIANLTTNNPEVGNNNMKALDSQQVM